MAEISLAPMSTTLPVSVSKAASRGSVEICLYDQIGEGGITANDFRDMISRVGKDENIVLRFNSPGGSVIQGVTIAGAIKRHGGEVVGIVDGLCASIATLLLVSCDRAVACEGSLLMIHRVSGMAEGGADDMRKGAVLMESMERHIVAAYVEKTGLPESQLVEMMADETWLSADEALALGFVDEVLPAEKATNELKKFDLSRFKNAAHVQGQFNQSKLTQPKNIMSPTTFTSADVENKVAERLAEIAEMDAIVAAVKKRDKKDFSALAEKARRENWTIDDFRAKLLSAEKWQSVNPGDGVVGSGPEESSFGVLHSVANLVVNNQALREAINSGWNTGSKIQINIPNHIRFDVQNTTMTESGAGISLIEHRPDAKWLGVQSIKVRDLFMQSVTNQTVVRYLRENTFTAAATTVAEGGTKPEFSLDIGQYDAPMRKIAVWSHISDECMADFTQLYSYLATRLPLQVELKEEQQILSGDGTGSNLLGVLNTSGIQTSNVGAGTRADAIFHAMTMIRSNAFYEPDAIVVHPTDWETLRLAKDANNQYFGAGPFNGAAGVDSLWGKPVSITTMIPQGTALVGAFKAGGEVIRRNGLMIEMSNSHDMDFIKNLTAIRAETRLGLAIWNSLAFCTVSGL